jgi:acetoin utilization deacetylase AcuC-like enzyme
VTSPTGFFLHPASPLHDTGWKHPEHQGRLRALASTVGRDLIALHGHVTQVEPGEATEEDLLRVHTTEHVEVVRSAARTARSDDVLVRLDADTVVSPASWEAALGSVGAVLEACRRVDDGDLRNAFVAARPPGHHATPSRAMGFCLFNSVAIAARWLQAHGRVERILIVDWDVHHGNGTQDAFYDDPSVTYLSLHQWPHYPGTGAVDDNGSGKGTGFTFNVPLPAATPRSEYLERFRVAVDRAWAASEPDFVLISAGFDALRGDPLGGMLLEPADFHTMTESVLGHARSDTVGIVALLEGGYDPSRTGQATVAVIRAFAGLEPPTP